jgi:hypothetical protein
LHQQQSNDRPPTSASQQLQAQSPPNPPKPKRRHPCSTCMGAGAD